MGHVEGSLDGTPVGIETTSKEILIESFVEIIDSIIECEHYKLGDLVGGVSAGDVLAPAVAILDNIYINDRYQQFFMGSLVV